MNRVTWIIVGILCLLGLSGLIYMSKKGAVNVDAVDPTAIMSSTDTVIGDHVEGNKDAKVTLFEYGDFQCPGCSGANQNTVKIQALYKDSVRFVFRNYPLSSIHPNALAAASVAEAAGLQGKYWEMHNLLYTDREQWVNLNAEQRSSMFLSFANQLSLDSAQFTADLSSSKIQRKIQLDLAIGNKAGVKATTPSFFIGATKIDSDVVDDTIQQQGTKLMDKLDQALRDAGVTPPTR